MFHSLFVLVFFRFVFRLFFVFLLFSVFWQGSSICLLFRIFYFQTMVRWNGIIIIIIVTQDRTKSIFLLVTLIKSSSTNVFRLITAAHFMVTDSNRSSNCHSQKNLLVPFLLIFIQPKELGYTCSLSISGNNSFHFTGFSYQSHLLALLLAFVLVECSYLGSTEHQVTTSILYILALSSVFLLIFSVNCEIIK